MNVQELTRPSGPILGARDEVAPTSPPTHLRKTERKGYKKNLVVDQRGIPQSGNMIVRKNQRHM